MRAVRHGPGGTCDERRAGPECGPIPAGLRGPGTA